jgi:hypothetical protein
MFKIEKENSIIELSIQGGTLLKGVWHEISFFHESVFHGPLSVIPIGPFQIRKFAAKFVNECLSAVLLTPVDKREEFYHLAC